MFSIYQKICANCSKDVTHHYSTSFSSTIRALHKDLHSPIYAIYGLVRFADEIVDTFHDFDKESLLRKFKRDTYEAIEEKMSLNPILYSFQEVVNKYNIPHDLIEAFFHSMEMDLSKSEYTERQDFNEYIYGSAEVVGLMCLQVFCEGDQKQYETLKPYAQALGAAFQKINFLRDIQADYNGLNRTYFPGFDFENFNEETKAKIELDIDADFQKAYKGIVELPWKARFGVYLAYKYYYSLFKKIRNLHPSKVLSSRIRIPDYQKMWIVLQAGMSFKLFRAIANNEIKLKVEN